MSSSILEKLKVKPVPKKIEQIQVKIMDPQKEETIQIKTKIIDKTKDKLINRDEFIKKLKVSVSTKMPEVVPSEPIPSGGGGLNMVEASQALHRIQSGSKY